MERPQLDLRQLVPNALNFRHSSFLILLSFNVIDSTLKLMQLFLEVILLCQVAKDTREVGTLLRSDLGGGCVGRGGAIADGEDAVLGPLHS